MNFVKILLLCAMFGIISAPLDKLKEAIGVEEKSELVRPENFFDDGKEVDSSELSKKQLNTELETDRNVMQLENKLRNYGAELKKRLGLMKNVVDTLIMSNSSSMYKI